MIHIPFSLIGQVCKPLKATYEFFRDRSLEKKIEPLRAAARKHPSQLAWTAEPGTKEYRFYEKMVRSKFMVRSPWFPGHYMLPTRWH